ncbi:hypothetical protein HZB00_02315 [Candidatus Woesearchaeota archaeon]|nr:hypothetical protein [Candidatus Woesearchaeota archaeon]
MYITSLSIQQGAIKIPLNILKELQRHHCSELVFIYDEGKLFCSKPSRFASLSHELAEQNEENI